MSDDSSIRSSAKSALAVAADPNTGSVIQKDTPCNQQKNGADDAAYKPIDNPELTQRQLAAIHFLLQGLPDAAVAERSASPASPSTAGGR
jgi:hypothetical protein